MIPVLVMKYRGHPFPIMAWYLCLGKIKLSGCAITEYRENPGSWECKKHS